MEALAIVHTSDKLMNQLPKKENLRLSGALNSAVNTHQKKGSPVFYLPYATEQGIPQFFGDQGHKNVNRVDTIRPSAKFTFNHLKFQSLMTRVEIAKLCNPSQKDIHITVGGLWRYACAHSITSELNRVPDEIDIFLFQQLHPEIDSILLKTALELKIIAKLDDDLCNKESPIYH